MEYSELIKERYSCKNFSDRQVEQEKLTKILEASRLAPTAKNLQTQHIYVLQTKKYLDILDTYCPCRYNAPTVLVFAYNTSLSYIYQETGLSSGHEDMAIVATHAMLEAYNQGVDSCWLNRFPPVTLAKELGLPENEEIVLLMDLGYGNATSPLPNHYSRKPLEETVTYLK